MQHQNTVLFDCPGYSDSYGCTRIISNGYFHYRVFSKVQNIKFVFTFSYYDMIPPASSLANSLNQFISGFSSQDFDKIYGDIFAATSIMITKVPVQFDRRAIESAFTSL